MVAFQQPTLMEVQLIPMAPTALANLVSYQPTPIFQQLELVIQLLILSESFSSTLWLGSSFISIIQYSSLIIPTILIGRALRIMQIRNGKLFITTTIQVFLKVTLIILGPWLIQGTPRTSWIFRSILLLNYFLFMEYQSTNEPSL